MTDPKEEDKAPDQPERNPLLEDLEDIPALHEGEETILEPKPAPAAPPAPARPLPAATSAAKPPTGTTPAGRPPTGTTPAPRTPTGTTPAARPATGAVRPPTGTAPAGRTPSGAAAPASGARTPTAARPPAAVRPASPPPPPAAEDVDEIETIEEEPSVGPPAAAGRAPSPSEIQRAFASAGVPDDAEPRRPAGRRLVRPEPAATPADEAPSEGLPEPQWDEVNNTYTFRHSGAMISGGPFPILYLVGIVAVLIWAGLYVRFYWEQDGPIPTLDEVQAIFEDPKPK